MKAETVFLVGIYSDLNLLVYRCVNPKDEQVKVVYEVKFLCCEREGTISHRALARRQQRGITLCKHCAQVPDPELRAFLQERRKSAQEMREAALLARERFGSRTPEQYGFVAPPWSPPTGNLPRQEWAFYRHQV